ncbi:hypothetical protein CRUP_036539, partial [Coryphaenoides rupestris]
AYLQTSSCGEGLCVRLRDYDSVRSDLQAYVSGADVSVWVGTEYTNYALYEVIAAQVRDAVAVIQLLMWLETAVPRGLETELTAAHYVNECRSKQKDSRGPSFETISASGPNAALAHYRWYDRYYEDGSLGNSHSDATGLNMEMLARRALWEVGLNYGHGTGHGIGNYFGVHEWPVGFGSNNIPFREGMFTSIDTTAPSVSAWDRSWTARACRRRRNGC